MKSYLLSTLAFRFGAGPFDVFARTFPHDWLVWEPGAWNAPGNTTQRLPKLPTPVPTAQPVLPGDALAIALDSPTHAPQLSLGRNPDCDLSISDGTLSGLHLIFQRSAQGDLWTVRDANSRNGTSVDGVKLTPGQPVPLRSGAKLVAAQLVFTYFAPNALFPRLKPP